MTVPEGYTPAPPGHHPALDDMHILSNDLTEAGGFTAVAVLRNEMYFLPAFLAHYRKLGVARFVMIDDKSDDGSRAFLAAQPDVMVLATARSYGERVAPPEGTEGHVQDFRVGVLWRQYLLDTFGRAAWSLLLDLDEFIHLPAGLTFPELADRLDPAEGEVVWSPMLDCYPEGPRDLAASETTPFDPQNGWFVDARAHLAPTSGHRPVMRYAGSRARLMLEHGLTQPKSLKQQLWWRLLKRPPVFNAVGKMSLQYWREGDRFPGVHQTTKPARANTLLPIQHFKFTGALYAKVSWAIESGAYFEGSREYKIMAQLLRRMQETEADFLCRASRAVTGYDVFEHSGNGMGLS